MGSTLSRPSGAPEMRNRDGPPEIGALKIDCCQWVCIVELFAHRRPGRRQVDPREYAVLHKALIQKCRMLAESGNEVDIAFYRSIEDLVQPWLTPSVLARADQEILRDLLARCRQVEHRLGVRSWLRSVRHWAPRVLVLSLVIAVGILMIRTGGSWHLVLDWLRGWSDDIWFAVKRSSDVERLSFVGIVLIIVSIFTVSRTARS